MDELERLEEDAKQAMKTPGFGMYANPAVVLDLIARLRAAESDLATVADWYLSLSNDVRTNAPEYIEQHPDLNAMDYLVSEVGAMRHRVGLALAPPA